MKTVKILLMVLTFLFVMALAAIKIGSQANWSAFFSQDEATLASNDSESFQEFKERWDRKIENGVILSE